MGAEMLVVDAREEAVAYLRDMIAEMAKLARRLDETPTAIHLEAILAAEQAARRAPSA